MGGGVDLALAELIAQWRLAHPEATLKDILEFFSSYKYHELKWPKSFHEKPLTSYVIAESKTRSRGQRARACMTNYDKALNAALAEINPVTPPKKIAEKFVSITQRYNLSPEETEKLMHAFEEHFNIDTKSRPPAVILRSGYQVPFEREEKVLDHLTTAILGESLAISKKKPAKNLSGLIKNLSKEVSKEIEHVQNSIDDKTVRVLFGLLLFNKARRRFFLAQKEVLPFLKTNPVRVFKLLTDAKQTMVLLLGKDTGEGHSRLKIIQGNIERQGLTCVLIRDQPEDLAQSLISKVLLFAVLSKCVIIENSYPSGHLYELPFVRNAEAIIAILQEKGKGATRMFDDMIPKTKLVKKFSYDEKDLEKTVQEALSWADKVMQESIEIHKESWPWLARAVQ